MAKIEKDVEDKNKDQMFQMDGISADMPKCNLVGVSEVDDALKEAKYQEKRALKKARIAWHVNRFYSETYD
jgi:hypothetical protein